VAQIAKRDDVTWQAVQEAHQSWNYSSQGLSGPAAAVIAIAVAIATQGAGAALLGAAGGLGGAVGGAMANAAFTALVSQASISMINNRGNIGKVLQELGSVETAKNLAITMAAAGAFYQVGTWTEGHFNDGTVLDQNGRPLTAVERADQYLGTVNHAANIVDHAVVGGAVSMANGGDFASGALSAGFGAAVTPLSILLNQHVPYSGLATTVAVGGATSALAGGDAGQGAWTAAMGYLFNAGFKKPDGSLGWEGDQNSQAEPSYFFEKTLGIFIPGFRWVASIIGSGTTSANGTFSETIFSSKAPDQVTPGVRELEGQHIKRLGPG
jgi:filamentous hemagglutinin